MGQLTRSLWAGLALVVLAQTAFAGTSAVRDVATLPVSLYGNHLFIRVCVNGSAPLDFVLDTGASDYGLNRATADKLAIPLKPLGEQGSIGTGEGTPSIAVADDVTFRIGDIELAHKVAYAVPFGALEEKLGRRIDGVIGADLFNNYVVEIDYAGSRVRLFDRASYRYAGTGSVIPLTFTDGRPVAKATLTFFHGTPLAGTFLVDAGDGSAIGLNSPFVQAHRLPAPGQPVLADVTYGIAGEARELRGRARELRFGRFVLNRPVVALSQATTGSTAETAYDGSIGGEVLRRFTVIFDYSRKQMILERGPHVSDRFEVDMSGLSLITRRPDLAVVEIGRVAVQTPASEAGLMPGDRIVTFDNRPVAEISLAALEAALRIDRRRYRMRIRRGDREFSVTLTMRRRI